MDRARVDDPQTGPRCAPQSALPGRSRRLLVLCAICERDQALVGSHDAADRVLTVHLEDCPGPATNPPD